MDCAAPALLAGFWQQVLGREVAVDAAGDVAVDADGNPEGNDFCVPRPPHG